MARRTWKRDRKGRFARTGSSSKSSKKSYSKKKGSSKKSNRKRNAAIAATAVVAVGVAYGASRRKGGSSVAPKSMPRGALVGPSKMKALGPGKAAVTNTRPNNSRLKAQAASRKTVGRDQGKAMGLTVTRKRNASKKAAALAKRRNSPNARLKRAANNRKRFGQDLRDYRGGGTTIFPGGGL